MRAQLATTVKTGWGLGAALLVLTALGLSLHVAGDQGIGSPERINVFVCLALLACMVYAWGVRLVLRRHISVWVVLLVLVAPPFLSTDLYRYVWDGRVQREGINPYLYVPAAPELAPLQDQAIFANINRPDYAVTIYPPVAQIIFRLVAQVAQSPYAIKATMMLFDALTIFVLMHLLKTSGQPTAQVVIYAWHPLPIWEFSGNGHVDAAGIGLISLGLLAWLWRWPILASIAMAASVLVKFLPAVLLPAIWHRREGRFIQWAAPFVFAGTVAVCYAFYASAGCRVLGFLPGYASEEGVDNETRLFPLAVLSQWFALPHWAGAAYYVIAALALLTLGGAVAIRKWPALPEPLALQRLAASMLLLATSITVALFPHYPWYFAWLLLPCTLMPTISVIYLTSATFIIYLAIYDDSLLWPCLVYGPFFLLAARDVLNTLRPYRLQRS
jgi:hypothetical protein